MAILNNLIVNGSSRFLNDAYFNILAADTGRFNKLATKVLGNDGETITVHGLMDVQGELHTKSWSNSNIATIDGSFFICPTLKVTETGSTSNGLTITQSGNTWSVQITSSSAVVTNSVYTMDSSGTVTTTGTWTLGSKVAITGEILVNNEWLPLGTLRGIITARSSDLKSVTISNITDGYSSSNNILNTIGVQSNVKHRNIKISLYEWTLSDSSTPTTATTNPIGIYMTALGDGTGQTMIDIYGGQEPSGTTYKGLAKPYVRIGNLSGLSNLSVGGQNPKGWGIYTSNGYFEGTIAARRGYIGNNTKYWTIGTSGTNSTIFSGPTTVSATGTAGTYLGTDGFLNTASSSVYAQITNGILTAKGVDITGKITASSGSIAGWRIESSYLASGSATAPSANVLLLSPSGTTSSYTIAGQAKTGWMITAGTTFGVNKDGGVYATSGKIGGWNITASSIQTGNYNTASTMYFGTSGLSLGTTFKVTSAGALTATGVDITGVIKANTGYIGGSSGWTIASQQISSGSIGADNSMFLSTKNLAGTVAGQTLTTTAPSWRLTVGSNFGVDNTGKLYAKGANITGTIDATSFSAKYYNGSTLTRQMSLDGNGLKLMDGSGTILSQIDGSASTIGKTSGNSYNLNITGTAIDLRYNTNVLNRIDSGGMVLYDGYGVLDNNIIAKFVGDSTQIGKLGENMITINSNSMEIWQKPEGASTSVKVAEFGASGAQIGRDESGYTMLKIDPTDSSGTGITKVFYIKASNDMPVQKVMLDENHTHDGTVDKGFSGVYIGNGIGSYSTPLTTTYRSATPVTYTISEIDDIADGKPFTLQLRIVIKNYRNSSEGGEGSSSELHTFTKASTGEVQISSKTWTATSPITVFIGYLQYTSTLTYNPATSQVTIELSARVTQESSNRTIILQSSSEGSNKTEIYGLSYMKSGVMIPINQVNGDLYTCASQDVNGDYQPLGRLYVGVDAEADDIDLYDALDALGWAVPPIIV